jgi:hypothetical protein
MSNPTDVSIDPIGSVGINGKVYKVPQAVADLLTTVTKARYAAEAESGRFRVALVKVEAGCHYPGATGTEQEAYRTAHEALFPYSVGRQDGTGEIQRFATFKEAEDHLDEIAKTDPKGIENGEYYLDGPEPMQVPS